MRMWASCKPQTILPTARTGAQLLGVERWQRTKACFFLLLFMRQSVGQRVLLSQGSEDTQQFHFGLNAYRKAKNGKGGLGTRRLERDFPDRLLAVSVTWKRCAVVWSFCVLVGHCAICTLGTELNIARLALAAVMPNLSMVLAKGTQYRLVSTAFLVKSTTIVLHNRTLMWRDLSHARSILAVKSAWACYVPNVMLIPRSIKVFLPSFYP